VNIMAACGQQDLRNCVSGSVMVCPGGRIPEADDDDEKQIVVAVRHELAHQSSARRPSIIEERKATVEKLVQGQLMKRSSSRCDSHSHVDTTIDEDKAAVEKLVKQSQSQTRQSSSRREPNTYVDKAVRINQYDSDTSDADTYCWDVVYIKTADDMSTLSSGENSCRKGRWLFIGLLLAAIIAVAVAVPLVLARDNDRSSNVAAATNIMDQPTPAPTNYLNLPPDCMPFYESTDVCLKEELAEQEADLCVDCVWRFLPSNRGYCKDLEASVCDIVKSCGCGPCEDELLAYLDCQTECEFNCQG